MLHGAFFLGPKAFYRALREMPPEQIARIQMMPVSFTNQLYGDEDAKRRARVDARFVNNAMMATLMGAAISDGLEDGQVVSGVGGQYNFVAQAFALQGARSILALEATRQAGAEGAIQHPLELRPSDHSAASARCLRHRIWRRRRQGKIRRRSDRGDACGDRLPLPGRTVRRSPRTPASCRRILKFRPRIARIFRKRIAAALKPAREAGLLPSFPFGSDFTDVEQRLIPALADAAGRAAHAAAIAGIVVAGVYAHAGCGRQRMPGAARPRPARDIGRARLSRAGQRGAGAEQGEIISAVILAKRAVRRDDAIAMRFSAARWIASAFARDDVDDASTCSCSPACASR